MTFSWNQYLAWGQCNSTENIQYRVKPDILKQVCIQKCEHTHTYTCQLIVPLDKSHDWKNKRVIACAFYLPSWLSVLKYKHQFPSYLSQWFSLFCRHTCHIIQLYQEIERHCTWRKLSECIHLLRSYCSLLCLLQKAYEQKLVFASEQENLWRLREAYCVKNALKKVTYKINIDLCVNWPHWKSLRHLCVGPTSKESDCSAQCVQV